MPDVVYVIGQTASGKSNFLDALSFLKDVANPVGGGLQKAVYKRGGIRNVRCLHARRNNDVEIEVDLSRGRNLLWTYSLAFNSRKDSDDLFVVRESVTRHFITTPSREILKKEHNKKNRIPRNFLETDIEYSSANKKFKDVADFFNQIKYFHPIPQFIKFSDQIGGRLIDGDPFGQSFIKALSQKTRKTRNARLKKIEKSLKSVVPQLENFNLAIDKISGAPHLEFKLKNYRRYGVTQQENQLSDGTLRLIAILWICYEFSGRTVVVEEPELSLNDGIVEQLSWFFEKSLKQSKEEGQIFVSTHNRALLSNPGINTDGLVVIKPSKDGSMIEKANEGELRIIKAGFPASDAILSSVEKEVKRNLEL